MAVFQREVLPNGLRLLSAPMPQVQSVACFIMLSAGSRYETAETSGIAHFAEHMFFKGTENRPTAQMIGNELDGIGAEFNAFTGKEYTGYYVKCAAEHRGRAFDVLVDMLRNSKFDPEEIEREKGVIVEEMNMYFDTPRDYIGGVYHQLLYGDTPLGWDIIGRKETVRDATRETFLDYVNRWYTAPKMVVGVAGNFDESVRQEIVELLGEVEAEDAGRPAPLESTNGSGSNVHIHTKESDQAHIAMGVPSYALSHPDRYALQLLGTVLGTGMSSRLFTEVRERRGARVLRLRDEPLVHRHRDALLAGRRRHQPHRRGDRDDRAGAEEDRRRAGARRGAREVEERRQGPLRAGDREPARDDHVRAAPRGARGRGRGAGGRAGRNRRGHDRGRPAGRAGRDRQERAEAGVDRAVRRRGALREDPGRLASFRGVQGFRAACFGDRVSRSAPALDPPRRPYSVGVRWWRWTVRVLSVAALVIVGLAGCVVVSAGLSKDAENQCATIGGNDGYSGWEQHWSWRDFAYSCEFRNRNGVEVETRKVGPFASN